ncbi:hypothetical protein CFP56_026086 [Quercus suber]|uniref:Uncharacterized protein n=1 Tax=Quercus suber TaxID=58331 RepID=A0AAW0K3Q6_QUESU
MGKLHSEGLPVYGERERTELFVGPKEKERKIQGRPLSIPWPDLDHRTASTKRNRFLIKMLVDICFCFEKKENLFPGKDDFLYVVMEHLRMNGGILGKLDTVDE